MRSVSDVAVVAVNPLDLTVPDRAKKFAHSFALASICLSAVVIGPARYSVASLTRSDGSVPERIIMSASAHPQATSC